MLASDVLKCPISRVVDRACDPSFFFVGFGAVVILTDWASSILWYLSASDSR